MAANILNKSKAVGYFSTMRAVVNHLTKPSMARLTTASNLNQSPTFMTDQDLGPFASKDPKFPLPGNMNIDGKVECSVQKCTPSLQRSFADLFPDKKLDADELTIICICQHTLNDMTVWSQDVDQEREELLKSFIESATDICELLKSQGYWADFIDPSSGNAYFGPYSNSTFFETDERYNQLGFRVIDLGCCKALSHKSWGTFIYVGSIFTNAPTHCLCLQSAFDVTE
ncbi:cobalamin trafficking protein CblD-like isoform X2 [Xenia sp. Carnegie-2017]|uniref:cobalamin trafficking protein CblD-like isoform X2 n=1 Tax=Xenia sp. Carnegie-2017 TaxID=2897299 RepID=UPI001F037D2E|nr:cobalamin trafficking protein CblD-like isoform X2 [Xenia sp. Carnegie-2017]